MSRVSAARRGAAGALRADASRPWIAALGWVAAGAAILLSVFAAHLLLAGHRLPLGPDGPVYVWWERYTDAVGLGAVRRPGVSVVGLVLETVLRADAVAVVAALEPALAVIAALAGAAVVETALGTDLARAGLTALLVGAFAALLAPGWLANLALVGLFLAALAAFAAAERSWRGAVLGAALLVAAGLTHSLFLAVALAIIAGAIALLVPSTVRRLRAGERASTLGPVRIAVGATVGAGLAGLAGLALAGLPETLQAPGDSSQDHFLRRLGLEGMLRSRFRERLGGDARRSGAAGITGLGLAALLPAWRRRIRGPGWHLLFAIAGSWAAVTLGGVLLLWTTGLAPAGRLLSFAYFVPLLAGPAAAFALRDSPAVRVVGALLVIAMTAGGFAGWYRRGPYMSSEELRTVGSTAAAIETLPPDLPLIFLVDTEELAAGFHISRFGNVIRAGLPGSRIDDVHIVVGGPDDLLAGRPGTSSDDPEYRAIAQAYLDEAQPVLDEAAVFVLEPFNRPGFASAAAAGLRLGPHAAALRLPEVPRSRSPAPVETGTSPWLVALLAMAALALLGVAGAGWARWGLPGASRLASLAAAPAVGVGVAVVATLVADRVGLPAAAGGTALAVPLGGAGYLLAAAARDDTVDRVQDP